LTTQDLGSVLIPYGILRIAFELCPPAVHWSLRSNPSMPHPCDEQTPILLNAQSVDLSLQRRISLGSRMGAILRWDVFNLLDRENFGLPNRDLTSPTTLGTITSLGGDARMMQLSVRLTF